MSKKKKVFLIVYVTILISIVIFLLNKIIAAENNDISLTSSSSDQIPNNVAECSVSQGGTPTSTPTTILGSFPTEYANAEDYANSFKENGIYMEDLTSYNGSTGEEDLYCLAKHNHLFGRGHEGQQLLSAEAYNSRKNNAIIPKVIAWLEKDVTEYSGDFPPLGYYKRYRSRFLDWSKLRVEKLDLSRNNLISNNLISDNQNQSYAAAYVFSKRDEYGTMYMDRDQFERNGVALYYNVRQYALWKIINGCDLNDVLIGELDDYIGSMSAEDLAKQQEGIREINELYEKANDFASYRANFTTPALSNTNSQYKFEYNTLGDYFIAGPITIEYTQLQLDTGDIVGTMYNPMLYYKTTDEDSEAIAMEESDFDITDEFGNHIDLPKDRN